MPVLTEEELYSSEQYRATASVSGSGDQTIIAAPGAGKSIVISSLVLQNESATSTQMVLKAGSTAILRFLAHTQGMYLSKEYSPSRELKLPSNTALVLNLGGANACSYSIVYYLLGG